MATILGVDHKVFAVSTIAVSVGIAGYAVYRLVQDRKSQKQTNIYESQKLVSEYLVFHYGSPEEILRWPFGPKNCLEFPKQCADLCMKYFKQVRQIAEWSFSSLGETHLTTTSTILDLG